MFFGKPAAPVIPRYLTDPDSVPDTVREIDGVTVAFEYARFLFKIENRYITADMTDAKLDAFCPPEACFRQALSESRRIYRQ